MKILITGAHFTPAVATIEQLKKIKGVEIVYVGRKTTLEGDKALSVESTEMPALGVKFIPLITGRLQRFLSIYTIPSLFKIPIGLVQSIYIILLEKPDAVLSFGGYIAVPIIIASWLFSIPIIIHEQAIAAGLANRISSFFASKIAVSFEDSFGKNEKVILTGNPLRRMVSDLAKPNLTSEYVNILTCANKKKLPLLLFTGGNQGSHIINQIVEECLEELTKIACVIHITGDNKFKDFERLQQIGSLENRYLVKKWIGKEYGMVLQKADLVISRAGINTLTELAVLGKLVLLVPIPVLEQRSNANYFENIGLAKILPQSKLSEDSLIKNIKKILSNLASNTEKAKAAQKIIIPDAAKRLALETILIKEC